MSNQYQKGNKNRGSYNNNGNRHGGFKAICAPYNFVPLNEWVYLPPWSRHVSLDLPFKDGYSGIVDIEIETLSPLLIGRGKISTSKNEGNKITPFKLTKQGDTYAIPGSSLKGMLRSIIEIVGFGRMRQIDDIRPGLRDISGSYVKKSYIKKLTQIKHGLLRRDNSGNITITPCEMAKIEHRTLTARNFLDDVGFKNKSVSEKYVQLQSKTNTIPYFKANMLNFKLDNQQVAVPDENGPHQGKLVFTGSMKNKTHEFVFYDPRPQPPIPVRKQDWSDFLSLHGDDISGKLAEKMPWPSYWRNQLRAQEDIPVFFIQQDDRVQIGLAGLPKLSGDFSVKDMIGHVSESHHNSPGYDHGYDLADLLFGSLGEEYSDALRGRVSVETATLTSDAKIQTFEPTVLSSPKPSYFPNYITQPGAHPDGKLKGNNKYATYIRTDENQSPSIRGFKRYPARPVHMAKPTPAGNVTKSVQSTLTALLEKTTFRGRISFHNLKEVELGALLWAIGYGERTHCHHSLGMGKAFGFGQIRINQLPTSHATPNKRTQENIVLDSEQTAHFINTFAQHMESACQKQGNKWIESPQIRNLLAMADPEAASIMEKQRHELRHMQIAHPQNGNEFASGKTNGMVLPDYATATGRTGDFGTKTAVGYPQPWPKVRLKFNRANKSLSAEKDGKTAIALAPKGEELLASLPPDVRKKVETGGYVKVTAYVKDNELVRVEV